MSNIKCFTIKIDEYTINLYTEDSANSANNSKRSTALEATVIQEGRIINIGKGLSARFDRNNFSKPYNPDKDHLHIFAKDNELFAINRDGTAHDGYHGVSIPSKVQDFIRSKDPDFKLPTNGILESMNLYDSDLHAEILSLLQE